jgi:hypothetical protein
MKLTNTIRTNILTKVITEKYGDKLNKVNKLFLKELEKEILIQKKADLAFLEHAIKIGMSEYVRTTKEVYLKTKEGRQIYSSFGISVEAIEEAEFSKGVHEVSIKMPDPFQTTNYLIVSSSIQKCIDDGKQTYAAAQKAYDDIKALLNSCATTKQLADTLPEIVKYLPACEECTTLVPVETVNRCRTIIAGEAK